MSFSGIWFLWSLCEFAAWFLWSLCEFAAWFLWSLCEFAAWFLWSLCEFAAWFLWSLCEFAAWFPWSLHERVRVLASGVWNHSRGEAAHRAELLLSIPAQDSQWLPAGHQLQRRGFNHSPRLQVQFEVYRRLFCVVSRLLPVLTPGTDTGLPGCSLY